MADHSEYTSDDSSSISLDMSAGESDFEFDGEDEDSMYCEAGESVRGAEPYQHEPTIAMRDAKRIKRNHGRSEEGPAESTSSSTNDSSNE